MSTEVTLGGKTFIINSCNTSISDSGLVTGRVVYLPKPAEYIKIGEEGPIKGSAHPWDNRLTLEKAEMDYTEGEGSVVATYTGMDTANLDPSADGTQTVPVYSFDYGLSEEPIETHPKFAATAGTPDAPTNGAVFMKSDGTLATEDKPEADANNNDLYAFARWESGSDHEGVSHYLSPSTATFTERFTTNERPVAERAGASLGKIDTPFYGPTFFSDHNWIYMGFSYEERGEVFDVTHIWKLSDENGWNTTWYEA